MRHPNVQILVDTLEKNINVRGGRCMASDSQDGVAILLAVTSADVPSVVPSNLLETVADSENGDLKNS